MPRPRSLRTLAINQNQTQYAPPNGISTGPPSPTLSEATQASQINFGANGPEKIITRADLKTSLLAYEKLLNSSASYRDALMHMSKATADLADAMEACASLKGTTYLSGSRLLAASGLHHLMGNHWHILSDTVDKRFEAPLRQHLDSYRTVVSERSMRYEKVLREKSRIIRQTEMENMNLGRKKNRNLQTFREVLAKLQRQVEELDELRVSHYEEILEHEEEVWDFVQGKVSLVVRSTLDVLDRFTAKASDPVIESMLQTVPDPFDSYGPPKSEDQIFSILAPLSIFNPSDTPSPQLAASEIQQSPSGLSWTSAHEHHPSDESQSSASVWDKAAPQQNTTPKSVGEATMGWFRNVLPRGSSYSSSTSASSSSASRAPTRTKSPRRRVDSLKNTLSVISEGHTRLDSSNEPSQRDNVLEGPPFGAHSREASADTVRGVDIVESRSSSTRPDPSQRNSFAEDPLWGSQEPTSPSTLRPDDHSDKIREAENQYQDSG